MKNSAYRTTTGATQSPGFTLIELLVVISIISLLIGILLPVLSAARELSQSARCLSNQRQTGVAFFVYASEFNDVFPPYLWVGHPTITDGNDWQRYLSVNYLNLRNASFNTEDAILGSILHCPADNTRTTLLAGNPPVRNITMNGRIRSDGAGAHRGISLRPVYSIRRTSEVALGGDGTTASFMDLASGFPGASDFRSQYWQMAGANAQSLIAGGGLTRHPNDTLNVYYVDGHAAAFGLIEFASEGLLDRDSVLFDREGKF